MPGNVQGRCITQARNNENQVAAYANADERVHTVNSPECAEIIQHSVDCLGDHCCCVISQPHKSRLIRGRPRRQCPDFVIQPDIEMLADRENYHAGSNDTRGHGKDDLERITCPVAR